jgi:di/tricarboxylate transporter
MSQDQIILVSLLAIMLTLMVWGRWRYDLVAFGTLILAVIIGVVPAESTFSGFGHPAVVIIALVLVITRGLSNSGAVELIGRYVLAAGRSLSAHIGYIGLVGAGLSAIMNNVAALALLMPLDIQAAERAKRSPSLSLMPLSFATIFGGLVTLIGTPPNIIISAFREKETGTPYGMLDFAPVGIVVATAGLIFLALIGWRLVPGNRRKRDMGRELAQIDEFVTELRVPSGSGSSGKTIADLDGAAIACDVVVLGLERGSALLTGDSRGMTLQAGDTIVVKGTAKELDQFLGEAGLEYAGTPRHSLLEAGDLVLYEAVVPIGCEFDGRTAQALALQATHGVSLLGISRRSQKLAGRIQHEIIKAGDILLLYGPRDRVASTAQELGGLSLSDRGTEVLNRNMAWTAVGIFAAAIVVASFKLLALPIALAAAALIMLLLNIVPVRQVYTAIDWPVIVLLGSLIPIGVAVEQSGATTWIAQQILALLTGAEPWQILAGLMAFTMLVANALNNTATAVVAGPIAATMAKTLGVNVDPFLMAVAVGASCAFLTPIGHKTNTLILGPGGYRFGDFWLIGLPASMLAVAVAVPMILLVWPL